MSYSGNSRKKEQRFSDLKPVFFNQKKLFTPAVYFSPALALHRQPKDRF
ncbi:hypothetical protein CLOAM1065 [Candidatus Cloacimonas acidaminovorans str. Evry]|uniref:Uncharacterized protein n=1 Tax=Cloacimonas acidaminovorans (strain Evry) TaxID=459349 RepID=B0VHW6_CLOAI|nr:hypothetical protein CLOAM1065 [Candidatus Cloacimonas acidaminovorans str. Evry]